MELTWWGTAGFQVKTDQIQEISEDETTVTFEGYRARASFSQHVKFDRWLLVKSLARINLRMSRYCYPNHADQRTDNNLISYCFFR